MIKILAVSDVEKNLINKKKEKVDLLINCGDLSPGYTDYLINEFKVSFGVMIHGNHDKRYYKNSVYDEENLKFSNIYKGFLVLNYGYINLKNYINKNIKIAGFSGALSHGEKPFHFKEKDVKLIKNKLCSKVYGNKKIDFFISHTPPKLINTIKDYDDYHKPSYKLGRLFQKIFPNVWLYGHIHKNYTIDLLDFKINGKKISYLLNTVPYKFIDYDEELKRIIKIKDVTECKLKEVEFIKLLKEE
ncbi:hypothetical protein OSSY52_09460 [Tepiditoga spiralis]|uniref:Calcineurin-like phosphoesterase domain-containing protein n=1 Tax=Tepiditoga spiralis TaxID=2108365 RepID=A0A7G1G409_9BACT|nr:metallophosphoesterase [Tepiditoga spiralis]BBE30805.1 hypothetical protein OSSY52_09460 [Tepiditoga spiralis]